MTIKISQDVLDNFVQQIEESNAKDQRVLGQKQKHYRVFGWMDDSEFVIVEEDLAEYQKGGYSVSPFTAEENEAQYELIRKSMAR